MFLAVLFTNSEIVSEKSKVRASAPCRALGSCLLCLMGNLPLRLSDWNDILGYFWR